MATRNLTGKFETYRNNARSRRTSHGIPSSSSGMLGSDARAVKDPLLSGGGSTGDSSGSGHIDIAMSIRHTLPPDWVNLVEKMNTDLKKVADHMKELKRLHDERLKVSFSDKEAEQERDIELLTGEITRLLRGCETSLKRISNVGAEGVPLPPEEKKVRLNVMRALGAQISASSKEFRKCQKEFIQGIRGQEEGGTSGITLLDKGGSGGRSSRISLDEALDRGLTPDQAQQLDTLRRTASDRDQEIIRIAQSVNELAQVFRELNMLVIEQGSLLDRIDRNIDSALQQVNQGVVQVKKANEYSKKALKLKCIVCLFVIILIMVAVLVLKKSV